MSLDLIRRVKELETQLALLNERMAAWEKWFVLNSEKQDTNGKQGRARKAATRSD